MDRNTAADSIKSGLAVASIAVAIFGLSFLIAIIYIG
jgi:hypothetical protein